MPLLDNVIYLDGLKTTAMKGGVWQIHVHLALAAKAKPENRATNQHVVLPLTALIESFQLLGPAARMGIGLDAKDMETKQ